MASTDQEIPVKVLHEMAVEVQHAGCQVWQCVSCLTSHFQARSAIAEGKLPEDTPLPEVRPAITVVPSWQTTVVGGQMVVACVTLPSCYDCLREDKKSPVEKAIAGGKILPGSPGGMN